MTDPRPPRILAVDDDPDLLLLLRSALQGDGHETIVASNGRVALDLIGEQEPDVVLLDLMMPVLDGWGVLRSLADSPVRPRVIVLSAKTADEDIARAFELGATEYVVKPFDPTRLLGTVREVLDLTDEQVHTRRERTISSLGRRDLAS
jgi:two-component system copper resistance phosphate regulon response regulator CusR